MSTMSVFVEDTRSEEEKDREYFEKYWPVDDWKLSLRAMLAFTAVCVWIMAFIGFSLPSYGDYLATVCVVSSLYATFEVVRFLRDHPID